MAIFIKDLAVCLLGCLAFAHPVTAQARIGPPRPVPALGPPRALSPADTGFHVRAWRKDRLASPPYFEGTLRTVTAESLSIESALRGRVISLALDSISRLEIATGKGDRSRKVAVTTAVGAIAGLWAGYEVGIVIAGFCESSCDGEGALAVGLALTGMFAGALAGGSIGGMLPAGRTWRTVLMPK